MKYLYKIIFGTILLFYWGFIYFSASVILFQHLNAITNILGGMTHLNVFINETNIK